ncbi:MAG: type II secretion system inner membrane protein GspF [Deltaproteobacteria bacterium]|jgi:general secretion pathway protein F|nr:type II secretion system inner membrane protein GspF [Deltaproteobacteria bacterium]
MPVYAWKGLTAAGKSVSGTRESDGPKSLRQVLRKESIFISEVREVVGGRQAKRALAAGGTEAKGLRREVDIKGLFERVKPRDAAVFTRQMATLLHAGIPLAEAMGALSEQADNKKLQMILAGVRQKVNEGGSFAEALSEHPKVFPELYTNMVRSGETAGNLDAVLARLADFMDAQIELRAKVASAMAYPILMTIVGSLVLGFLMTVVVPPIAGIFADSGKALPWNTQLLVLVADILGGYWWLLLPLAVGLYLVFRRWSRKPKGRAVMDRFKLRVWLIGRLVRLIAVARFSRTLATMLASGVPVLTALEIVKRVLNNTVLEKVVEEARVAIREGESIAATLKKSGQFPSMMCHMVAVGERSGQLEAMLENVATAYERDVATEVGKLTSILAPLMIVVMAVGVGFIVFSILGPIIEMGQMVQ